MRPWCTGPIPSWPGGGVTLPQSAPGIQIEYNPAIAAISAALIFVVVLVLVPLERRLGLLTQRGVSGD